MIGAAVEHYRGQAELAAVTVATAQRTWDQLDANRLDQSWPPVGRRLIAALGAAQLRAAVSGVAYAGAALAEQGITAPQLGQSVPQALVGVASDGRSLGTLLYSPVALTKRYVGGGLSTKDAMVRGRSVLARIVATQVQDAGRAATGVSVAARPAVDGYVRMLNLPACSRCVILAGQFYRWSEGFLRHPQCDCRHVPSIEDAAGDLRTDPAAVFAGGQVTGLSAGAAQAIADGADPVQVVNAARGVYVAGGRRFTREGVTRRQGQPPRLMPEELYRQAAGDRATAIRLLIANGYLRA